MQDEIDEYVEFARLIKLGLTIGINEIPFEKLLLFGYLSDELNGQRKTNI